jgi:PhzF family phenazine biosynthesis protein
VTHRVSYVDVFGAGPMLGNPVAVVHDADDLDVVQMQLFAQWANLSETTFLLSPTEDGAAGGADYRLRIFTPSAELPFAGHPTLGSAHAWLEALDRRRDPRLIVQECGVGLVRISAGERLAFEAPPLVRSGPVSAADLAAAMDAIGLDRAELVEAQWCDNGPGWMGLLVRDAEVVLALRPDFPRLRFEVGVVGPRGGTGDGADTACEVRAFCTPGLGLAEDPVTGSLNASLAQWLAGTRLPTSYVAAQGTVIGRAGRVHVRREEDPVRGSTVWVGGSTVTTLRAEVAM